MSFTRPHHQKIAAVLASLDADFLRSNKCYFGGGTAIALRCNEFRESVDLDFLVSDLKTYRSLRAQVREMGPAVLFSNPGAVCWSDVRADQYGIRTRVGSASPDIKFEIVLEGRIEFEVPSSANHVLGVSTLTRVDLAAEKLLANSDRWADSAIHRRDLIDLAMMQLKVPEFFAALNKAEAAYGPAVSDDLLKAIAYIESVDGELQRCSRAMKIETPLAKLWHCIRQLRQVCLQKSG